MTDLAEKLKDAAAALDRNGVRLGAARLAEEAAELAGMIGDVALERKARLRVARAWGDHVVSSPLSEPARKRTILHIHQQLRRLEELGEGPARLALERALVARLEEEPVSALRCAEEAAGCTDDDVLSQADALIVRLQALRQLHQLGEALALGAYVDDLRGKLTEGDAGLQPSRPPASVHGVRARISTRPAPRY